MRFTQVVDSYPVALMRFTQVVPLFTGIPFIMRWLTIAQFVFVFVFVFEAAELVENVTAQQCQNDLNQQKQPKPPMVVPKVWLPQSVSWQDAPWHDVVSYSATTSNHASTDTTCSTTTDTTSATIVATDSTADSTTNGGETLALSRIVIGRMPQFTTSHALHVLDAAVAAWQGGAGVWTASYSTPQRVASIRAFLKQLQTIRSEIVTLLQWEIGKNQVDAESEFDRTIQFAELLIETIENDSEFTGRWQPIPGSSVTALTKRAAIGIILALAPYNYPLNESYATILPALLLGNIVILKIPTIGGLAHLLTMQALASTLPPGTIHFISGSGRDTMPPLMASGKIDGLAFIGGHKAADTLIHAHPHPHRLHTFLQLEAKNMAVLLDDVFATPASLDEAVSEVVTGSLSFNGQRCTALKLVWVPRQHADAFIQTLVQRIENLTVGLPWQTWSAKTSSSTVYSQITPLPNHDRITYLQSLLADAVGKNANVMNANGGRILGGPNSTLMVPAVVYPVTPDMRLYTEEQFGPIVPIAVYDDLETVLQYGESGEYAQQVSIFGHHVDTVATMVDRFGAVFGKINLNSQCGRSPDTLAFSGRRSSAMGVMSVYDALREFSVPTVLAYKNSDRNDVLSRGLNEKSVFLDAGQQK